MCWQGVSLCVPWARCAQNMMGNILKEKVDIVELLLRLSLRVGALAHCLFACGKCVCVTCARCVCASVFAETVGDSKIQRDATSVHRPLPAPPACYPQHTCQRCNRMSRLPLHAHRTHHTPLPRCLHHTPAHQTPHLLLCPGFPRSRLLLKRLLHLQQEPRTVRPPLHLPHLHPPAPAPLDPPDICLTSAPASLPHIPVPGAWRRTQRSVLVSPDGPR